MAVCLHTHGQVLHLAPPQNCCCMCVVSAVLVNFEGHAEIAVVVDATDLDFEGT